MQQRRGYISKNCALFFKCNESSGDFITDSVQNVKYKPSSPSLLKQHIDTFGSPNNDGFVAFNTANSVRIQNDTSNLPTPMDLKGTSFNPLTDVILLAAVVSSIGAPSRVNLGVVEFDDSISNSMLVSNMHATFGFTDDSKQVSGSPDMLAPLNSKNILYIIWDGPSSTITAELLGFDGLPYNDGTQNFTLSLTESLSPPRSVFTPGNFSRLTNGDYYSIVLASYDAIPSNLRVKLAQWGTEAVKGNKGFPDF